MHKSLEATRGNMYGSDYKFDPETEDIFYGDELKNGMVVLIKSGSRIDDAHTPEQMTRRLERNRWSEISKFRIDGRQVSFVATYSDGDVLFRQCGDNTGWIVKKDSIPEDATSADLIVNVQLFPSTPINDDELERIQEAIRQGIQDVIGVRPDGVLYRR